MSGWRVLFAKLSWATWIQRKPERWPQVARACFCDFPWPFLHPVHIQRWGLGVAWLLRSGVTGIPCPSYYNKIITVLLLWPNDWSLNSHKISGPLRLPAILGCGLHSFNIICWKLQPATLQFYYLLHLDNWKVKSRWPTCQIYTTSRIPNKKPHKPKYWRPLKTKQNEKLWLWWLQISRWRSSLLLNVRTGTLHVAQDSRKLHLEMIIFCLFNIVNNIL